MQSAIKTYFLVSNIVAAILLILAFEPLSETVEVINENAVPMLKQLQERYDEHVQANSEQRLRSDSGQAFAYIERLLTKAQTEALHTRTGLKIIVPWLLINSAVSWWCFRRQHGVTITAERD